MCTNFQTKWTTLSFWAQICSEIDFRVETSKILSLDLESASLRSFVHQFSEKMNNFELLGPNLPKNRFWGRNFENLSLDLESALPRYHVCQFSVKTDNFAFFGPNLPKKEIRIRNSEN